MKIMCRNPGCSVLVASPGYCAAHKKVEKANKRKNWERLDLKKTPEQRAFYNSNAWKIVSILFRKENPLCEVCKTNNRIKKSDLVHHEPNLNYLLKNNLDPLKSEYLHSICNPCHLKELREGVGKKEIKKNKNESSLYFARKKREGG